MALGASLIGFVNLFVGVLNFIKPAAIYKDVSSSNYEMLKVGIKDEDELPLLKALIIMKSKHPEFSLKALMRSNENFNIKTLFEILYLTNADLPQDREVAIKTKGKKWL